MDENEKLTTDENQEAINKKKEKAKITAEIVEQHQEIMLAGVPYKMRRLNTRDVFRYTKIMSKAMRAVGNVDINPEAGPEIFGMVMVEGLSMADSEVAQFFGDIIGLKGEEFFNLPPEAFGEFMEQLSTHHDMASFFQIVLRNMQTTGALWQKS